MSEKNINCDIVKDLLPLYHDKVVNDSTAIAVEEHLNSCENCSREYDSLCTELSENLSSEKKGVKALLKSIKHKGLIKGITIAVLCFAVLLSSFFVLTQVPVKTISSDNLYANRVYKCDGVFFVFYNREGVFSKTFGKEVLSKNGKQLEINIKAPVIDLQSLFSTNKEKSKIYEMDWITDNCYENVDKLTLNGKVIWSEEENGKDEIPDYIKEYVYQPVTFGDNEEENSPEIIMFGGNQVTVQYSDGSSKVWDIDGKLISDNSISKN